MRCAAVKNPPIFTHPIHQPVGHRKWRSLLEAADIMSNAALHILGMHAFGPAVALFLLQRAPAKIEPSAVEIETTHVETRHPDQHGSTIRQFLKTIFTAERGSSFGGFGSCHVGDQAPTLPDRIPNPWS